MSSPRHDSEPEIWVGRGRALDHFKEKIEPLLVGMGDLANEGNVRSVRFRGRRLIDEGQGDHASISIESARMFLPCFFSIPGGQDQRVGTASETEGELFVEIEESCSLATVHPLIFGIGLMDEEDNSDFRICSACLANNDSVYELIKVHKNYESRLALGERFPDLSRATSPQKAGEA